MKMVMPGKGKYTVQAAGFIEYATTNGVESDTTNIHIVVECVVMANDAEDAINVARGYFGKVYSRDGKEAHFDTWKVRCRGFPHRGDPAFRGDDRSESPLRNMTKMGD